MVIHVKGHQDALQPKEHQLALPEHLNINCNTQAVTLPQPHDNRDIYMNPETPASYPHLHTMQETIVIRQLQHTLQDSATQAAYFAYLQDKFQWVIHPLNAINWQIMHLSLCHFEQHERKT